MNHGLCSILLNIFMKALNKSEKKDLFNFPVAKDCPGIETYGKTYKHKNVLPHKYKLSAFQVNHSHHFHIVSERIKVCQELSPLWHT